LLLNGAKITGRDWIEYWLALPLAPVFTIPFPVSNVSIFHCIRNDCIDSMSQSIDMRHSKCTPLYIALDIFALYSDRKSSDDRKTPQSITHTIVLKVISSLSLLSSNSVISIVKILHEVSFASF
jgi:hypothetical protein